MQLTSYFWADFRKPPNHLEAHKETKDSAFIRWLNSRGSLDAMNESAY